MNRHPRKTNPGVRDGIVQKKHRTDPSPGYRHWVQEVLEIDRRRPGVGYRHLLSKAHVARFVQLIPDWRELSGGLDAVVLGPGNERADGSYWGDLILINAWPRDLRQEADRDFVQDHARLLDLLNVPMQAGNGGNCILEWTEGTARAYQLLHVFLHELGHHVDRMTTRSRREASRGEGWAEEFAWRRLDGMWRPYVKAFGEP